MKRIHDHESAKIMLALGFSLMIGMTLIAEGAGFPKGFVYTAMASSALIEALNIFARRSKKAKSHGDAKARMPVHR